MKLFKNKKSMLEKESNPYFRIYNIFIGAVIAIYCISLLLPLVWMVFASFKTEMDYTLNVFGFPKRWMISNYIDTYKYLKVNVVTAAGIAEYGIEIMAANSVIRSAGSAFMSVFVMTCVAYVMSKYRFRGNSFIYALGIFIMITPIVGSLPSAMLVKKALGIYDNMLLHIITGPSNIFGLHFLILYGAFKSISWHYAEAAFIDGAGHYRVMFTIMLPMVLPLCTALFTLSFLNLWNDYLTPMIWLPSFPNLAYGIYKFQYDATAGSEGATGPMILAGFTIVMVPTVILYLSMQSIILNKVNVGGLKG